MKLSESSRFWGWYYERDGRSVGPLTSEDLAGLIESGQLRVRDNVLKAWKDGDRIEFFHSRAGVAIGRGDYF